MQQGLSIPPSLQMILAFTGCPAALDATSISANHSSLVGPRSRISLWQKCRINKIVFKQLKFKVLGGIDLCHVFSCATCRIHPNKELVHARSDTNHLTSSMMASWLSALLRASPPSVQHWHRIALVTWEQHWECYAAMQ